MSRHKKYKQLVQNPGSTVMADIRSLYEQREPRPKSYESEAELERNFIEQLQAQGYEYLNISSEEQLVKNLRRQLEKLNGIAFSESEWKTFFKNELANPNQNVADKTATIQEDHIKILRRDDGSAKNIYLLDKQNIHNNNLQVINQYATDSGKRPNRYDVTLLVNGLPLVHIELKRRGVAIKEAFNQIKRYRRESFWADSGLFEYVQLFVISNGTHTKYYSNTTREKHIKEKLNKKAAGRRRSSNSFEFTNWWADANNQPIAELSDFTRTFLTKHVILNILTRYCVFTAEQELLVMRPYQIAATERILNKIEISSTYNKTGSVEAGGYVWHTTGSGKTLTSFKASQLASRLPRVDKVLFVVDRKDLDYQTMREYDKFQKGAANSNSSTKILKQQLEDRNSRIIITTIQKLDNFIKKNPRHQVYNKHLVLIFDECHRSQFGDMHRRITKAFKKYHLFGFTGTPIFAANAASGGWADLKTTEQAFGEKLHTYTIVNAIADGNVLPFKVDYITTMREKDEIEDKKISAIDRKRAIMAPERIQNIVRYILEHFDQKTKRNSYYQLKERRLSGFNSIFAVDSIDAAKAYYTEFKKQLEPLPSDKKLKIATIFSYGANEELDGIFDENPEDTRDLDESSRDFLERAIQDYNDLFNTSFDTSSERFQNYYKDVSRRVKTRQLDLLIVVNMFLTGFDATTLNTLWVDKNLRLHGLLQAYSRTNRILNSIKTFGNIVCFRNLEKATNKAIALFGDKEAGGIVLLKSYRDYYEGYTNEKGREVPGYRDLIAELLDNYPVEERILGEQAQKDFIKLYGEILRRRNILDTFDEFEGHEILSQRELQDYHSIYIDLYHQLRQTKDAEKEIINDDLVFEMELIKQVEINIDYILGLIKKYHEQHSKDKEILVDINKAIDSSMELRNKKDLIQRFIETLDPAASVDEDWRKFVKKQMKQELEQIIKEENLRPEEARKFIQNAFRNGYVETIGTAISSVLPPLSRFSPGGERSQKREAVLDRFTRFFNRFFDIVQSDF